MAISSLISLSDCRCPLSPPSVMAHGIPQLSDGDTFFHLCRRAQYGGLTTRIFNFANALCRDCREVGPVAIIAEMIFQVSGKSMVAVAALGYPSR
jgi:hypothetical protein